MYNKHHNHKLSAFIVYHWICIVSIGKKIVLCVFVQKSMQIGTRSTLCDTVMDHYSLFRLCKWWWFQWHFNWTRMHVLQNSCQLRTKKPTTTAMVKTEYHSPSWRWLHKKQHNPALFIIIRTIVIQNPIIIRFQSEVLFNVRRHVYKQNSTTSRIDPWWRRRRWRWLLKRDFDKCLRFSLII